MNVPPASPIATQDKSTPLPRNVWAVTLTSFLTDISSEMVFNLLPLFLTNVLGVRTGVVGLIEGLAATAASLLKVVSGWLSDRLGNRKWLAVAGYALSTLAKPFLYVATTWSAVLGVRFADRVGKGIRTAPRDALVADSVSEKQRGLAFGLHRAGDTAGAVLGVLAALLVVRATQAGSLTLTRPTFQRVVLLSIIPAALAVLALALGAQDVSVEGRRDAPQLRWRAFDRRFRHFLIAVLLFTLGNSSDAFIILRAQERGLNVPGLLGMLITFNVVYTLVSGPAGALSDRVGRRALIVSGWLTYALIYLGLAFAATPWQVWALFALYGVYYGAAEGTARALVADLVPSEQRGVAYGMFSTLEGLAAFPASLIAGLLWQGIGAWSGFGPGAPFLFGAVLAVMAVTLLVAWLPAGREASPPATTPEA
jgi:MFS family permease